MDTKTFSGTIESAYGRTFSPALKFEGEYDAYSTVAELRSSKDFPDDKEILAYVNAQRKANARQKLMQETLNEAGVEKPTLANDPQMQLKNIIKSLEASGKHTHEAAVQIAEQVLGVKLAA